MSDELHSEGPLAAGSSLSPPGSAPTGVARQKSRWRWVLLIPVTALVFVVYVSLVPKPRLAQGILVGTHGPDGGSHVLGDVSPSPLLAAHAATVNSKSTFASSTVSSHSDDAVLADRSIAIFNRSEHLLMGRVGLALFEALQKSGRFESVRYVPLGSSLASGQRLPDLFVTLNLASLSEVATPLGRKFDAQIVATLGTELYRSNASRSDHLSRPEVEFGWRGELHYQGDQTGFESSGARYATVSAEITKAIDSAIQKELAGQRDKHGPPLPVIPEFEPAYLVPPALPVLELLHAQKLLDGCGFMLPSVAMWRFDSAEPGELLRKQILPALEADGWKNTQQESGPEFNVWLERDTAWLRIFAEPAAFPGAFTEQAAEALSRSYLVSYARRMSQAEIDEGLQSLLQRAAPESSLVLFSRWWEAHRGPIEEFFREHPAQSPRALQWLADWHTRDGHPEQARELYLRAAALDQLLNSGKNKVRLAELSKKAGLPELPAFPEFETIEHLGLPDLRPEGVQEFVVDPAHPFTGILAADESEIRLQILSVSRNADGAWSLKIGQRHLGRTGSNSLSWMEHSLGQAPLAGLTVNTAPDQSLEIECRPRDQPGHYRLTLIRRRTLVSTTPNNCS
ncbi:MAG: hypothetical protein ACKV0T_27765 [Planctomycetales bacterium]